MKVKKNDNVIVIAGNNNGKKGKVLKVFPKKNRIIVEGVNIRKRHTKPNQQYPNGGIIEKELPIDASNVMLVDPKTSKPTRVGSKVVLDEKTGKKKSVRIAKKSNEVLS